MRGALMVCGTGSDAGKSRLVTGLCRWLHRRGVTVAPFKAQNMALNSYVTPAGQEIGRAQGIQALAAGVDPHVDMNPILLKPTGECTSQVVVLGAPFVAGDTPNPGGHFDAVAYHAIKPALRQTVLESLDRLRARFDVVVMEGAGSPAEINLLDGDLVNLWLAATAGVPAVVVGDIDRGGVFAALYGTVGLLPDDLRRCVRGFVINKFRGDPALLAPGLAELEARTGVPTLGVVPWTPGLDLDAEDSLALPPSGCPAAGALDVAVVRLPRISNFTDFDALALEPAVSVRYVEHPGALGDPDLAVLPGTKATVSDLAWLRDRGFVEPLSRVTTLLGICGGYQMLGRRITDCVESGAGRVEALGWLPSETAFEPEKATRPRRGAALGQTLAGYQIHHGRTVGTGPWIELDDSWGAEPDGARSPDGRVLGTTLHGLFEADGFRTAFLTEVARRRAKPFGPSGVSFAAAREAQLDRLADLIEAHLDTAALEALIKESSGS
ncbi:MAG: cobyric acid synthase [Actinomycetota bacterium]|nr:cobyric acid synthase [Actinomycetota bacterium]